MRLIRIREIIDFPIATLHYFAIFNQNFYFGNYLCAMMYLTCL